METSQNIKMALARSIYRITSEHKTSASGLHINIYLLQSQDNSTFKNELLWSHSMLVPRCYYLSYVYLPDKAHLRLLLTIPTSQQLLSLFLIGLVVIDQSIRRTIVTIHFTLALQLWQNLFRQSLTELDTPLICRVMNTGMMMTNRKIFMVENSMSDNLA
jgi:hypothetical protein